ncbi:MAG: DUF3047 domain-containing protein [Syntrophaceae bacterium]|nr:DUF3047 domain-containing protein [Syntrophaceae bacterium]
MRKELVSLTLFFLIGSITGVWAGSSEEKKDRLVVDRFTEGGDEKGIPKGWTQEKELGPQSKISVGQEKEFSFVHLLSVNDGFGIKKELSFDIRKYPHLTWRWKATRLPKGGDIRKRETDDQAGQIYVLFPRFPAMINTRSMGYIWDALTPVGTAGTSTAYSRMKYVVLQSGPDKLGQWTWETRNVLEDYKKYFQEDPPQVGGLLLYINTQHTQSSAEIYYGEIFFSARPPGELK